MNTIDWQQVETLVDSERRPFYQTALSEAQANRDALQQRLFAVMDQCAWLRFKLRETERRLDWQKLDEKRDARRNDQQSPEAICIE